MIRFLACLPFAILVWMLSFLFPESKSGEFQISRKQVRKLGFWMIGFKEF
jgi:hypothetical protein